MILSVDYRLAPEHPAPCGLDDCHAALSWLHTNAIDLGINPVQIAVGGESAGAGLAAALALRVHGDNPLPICFQLLTYPMLDDRTGTAEYPGDPLTGEFVWTRDNNRTAWKYYLGEMPAKAPCVPARATDLTGLPPAWIGTAALDLFREENTDYAQRLMGAGVQTELIIYPGACHGFQMTAETKVSKRFYHDHREALRRGLLEGAYK